MTQEAASRIQSAIDKKGDDATKADQGFKARTSSAAAKNDNNGATKPYRSGCGGCSSYSRK